ncbi:hypothetical protein QR680_018533 [Steinernema hermaphroditum]|uniref:MADF domain-containing protein n=1 Tax=Steinernema hermaphroditum TaxID=289476 RepID=A0AA39LR91_9BILA|nr:hypothetical protein QR680_018533 [Steinernema hermaphroditum]
MSAPLKPVSEMTVDEIREEYRSYGQKLVINEGLKSIYQKQLERLRLSRAVKDENATPGSSSAKPKRNRSMGRYLNKQKTSDEESSTSEPQSSHQSSEPPAADTPKTPLNLIRRASKRGRSSLRFQPPSVSSPPPPAEEATAHKPSPRLRKDAPASPLRSPRGRRASKKLVSTPTADPEPAPEPEPTPVAAAPQEVAPTPKPAAPKEAPQPQEPSISAAEVTLANAMKECRPLFDSRHADFANQSVTLQHWMNVLAKVGHKGPLSSVMKAWDDLVKRYQAAKTSEGPSEIKELLKFIDEHPQPESTHEPAQSTSKASRKRAAEPEDRTPKRPKTDEALNETPIEVIEEVDAFSRFIGMALRRMPAENMNAAMDDIYAIIRKHR